MQTDRLMPAQPGWRPGRGSEHAGKPDAGGQAAVGMMQGGVPASQKKNLSVLKNNKMCWETRDAGGQ